MKKNELKKFINEKIIIYTKIIQDINYGIHYYKHFDVKNICHLNNCLTNLEHINNLLKQLQYKDKDIINKLQNVNDLLYNIIKKYGCYKLNNLLKIIYGNKFNFNNNEIFELLENYFHPISFKIIKNEENVKLTDNIIMSNNDESKNFFEKVNSISLKIYDKSKIIIINGIIDNISVDFINNIFIQRKIEKIKINKPTNNIYQDEYFDKFIDILTLKELMVYDIQDIYNIYQKYIIELNNIKQKTISKIINEFNISNLFDKRNIIYKLLLKEDDPEYSYLAYLLYDLLSDNNNDSIEQTKIYDSFSWKIKKLFKNSMTVTKDYTTKLMSNNLNENDIALEQRICLMKVADNVKEKAMTKLKEIKSKTEDSGSKSRQFLEGLLKIPFGIYKKEPILKIVGDNNDLLKEILIENNKEAKDKYNHYEIINILKNIKNNYNITNNEVIQIIYDNLSSNKKKDLINNVKTLNKLLRKNKQKKITYYNKNINELNQDIYDILNINKENDILIQELKNIYSIKQLSIAKKIDIIDKNIETLNLKLKEVRNILNDSVYGHLNAKRQIERIIGQWICGKQNGYCFGFEGPPGVGKTSLAKKGLSKCLKDENNNSRPFGFIAIGGSSNGSLLDGHNYTYVGSTWGRIVDILMESKCMNPIIFIDELDKISKTEHGKEIIGILTHLVDPTQNDTFQDKYFNGIDIDLSKALFIFSYNDVGILDKILLDRIHRIKFDNLELREKIVICRNYILPEIYEKININNEIIYFNDEIISFIIETYTCESGVRKLKQILFEIISEINLELLQTTDIKIPVTITKELIENKYLKDSLKIRKKLIHKDCEVGIMNGLWANALGHGGIIPIQATYYPSGIFLDLKLTGMQGDVMKESMNVAKTLAYKLTPKSEKEKLVIEMKKTQNQGIHIHCPEGATPKDGPSAGTAITISIYSLLNNKKIKNNIAITGEINLQGHITAIGGLDLKIIGGIQAGINEFIFPRENEEDFKKIKEKHKDKIENIQFHIVENINEVLDLVFV